MVEEEELSLPPWDFLAARVWLIWNSDNPRHHYQDALQTGHRLHCNFESMLIKVTNHPD